MNIPDGYPEILAELAALIADVLAADCPRDQADDFALRVAERLRHVWGGQEIYIPRGRDFDCRQRDRALYDDFSGNNHAELCEQYGLGLQQVYECINRERARRRQRLA